MAEVKATFSESWHRVADLKVALRPSVRIRKQLFRGQTWYLLQEAFSEDFYRLKPAALEFVKRLDKQRSIATIWDECLQRSPETAPGQEEVIQLLAQLYHANLLFCELPIDSRQLFNRYQKQRRQEVRAKFLNLMFLRIPLFDPSRMLNRYHSVLALLSGRLAAGVWLATLLLAGATLVGQSSALLDEAGKLLEVDNLLLLYISLILVKCLHELGHTLICRKYGGEVHQVGVMLIFFTPLPYMDATASWAFRQRRQRIFVAAAGMLYELFAAACAALIWAHSGPGSLHNLAFNMMIVASVSTLVFNLNPLLRFDGYYILADLLDIPNLQQRALEQLKYLAQRWLFGDQQATSATGAKGEAAWLFGYSLASVAYRLVIYVSILLFIADRYLIFGLLLAAFSAFSWGVLPCLRFIAYLTSSPQLARNRNRAIATTVAALLILISLLGWLPVSRHFRAPGVLEAQSLRKVVTEVDGQLLELLVANDSQVVMGTPLAQLQNPELELDIALIRAQTEEVTALLQQSLALAEKDTRQTLEKQLITLKEKLTRLQQQQEKLLILAPSSGTWIGRSGQQLKEAWLKRGSLIGQLVAGESFKFSAVVSQAEAANLFHNAQVSCAVRLTGNSGQLLAVSEYQMIPFQQRTLPSAALGLMAGGEIAVSSADKHGRQTLEPFFQINATLQPTTNAGLRHGHSGQIRFELAAESLFKQGLRKVQQFFQQRYQL
jgi:putative peptide zinc metalloprotease protein